MIGSATISKAFKSIREKPFWSLLAVSMVVFTVVELREGATGVAPFNVKQAPVQPKDNEKTADDPFLVPNIIHFIRSNYTSYTFVDYVCLLAAYRNQRPDYIYIHTDRSDQQFTGKYWDWVQQNEDLKKRIKLYPLEAPPMEIEDQPLSTAGASPRAPDLARFRILRQHGGIYLDNDVFVVNSLDKYRKFEATVGRDENGWIANQVQIASKDARYLKYYLEGNQARSYQGNSDADIRYFKSGEGSKAEIAYPHPELVNLVKDKFGVRAEVSMQVYQKKDFNWRDYDTIHLLINHRSYLDEEGYARIPEFSESNIRTYEYPFGEMVREVLADVNPKALETREGSAEPQQELKNVQFLPAKGARQLPSEVPAV